MMADPSIDKFKVWPTQLDRPQFTNVVSAGSRDELLKRYPLRRRPYARQPDPRPRTVEAYLLFFDQLKRFFLGDDGESPLGANYPISTRVDECFQTLRNALMVVVIDLQKDDDPQVIFETKDGFIARAIGVGVWPDDAAFGEAWLHKPLYGPMSSSKLVHLYARLNQTYMSSKEALTFSKPPTVEHIMPQDWIENWQLPDGSKGMDFMDLYQATENDPRAAATRKRERALQSLGNLTILSTSLNAAQSNYGWDQKRQERALHIWRR
jgi:hypothetical protein